MRRIPWLLVFVFLATLALVPVITRWVESVQTINSVLALAMALLFPLGLMLLAAAALPADRSPTVAALAMLALALAVIGYFATGFAFHFGGAAFVSDQPGLQNLSRFFSLVSGDDSARWGFVGLEGFFLGGDAATPTAIQLFVAQLPAVMAATLIVVLALPRRTPLAGQFLIGLVVSAVTYPLAGFWTGGGGWLARLGQTLSLGHGLVDFAGAGTLFVQSGATALAATLIFKRPADAALAPSELSFAMPQSHRSLLAGTGALLAASGWIAMNLVNPLYTALGATLNWPLIALNGLAGLAGGALAAQLYSGFSTGRLDPLWGPRGALAGLIAVSAGAPFLPTWAALLSGAVAGLLLPFAHYTVERLLRLEDNTAAVASYLLPGLWGLVAVALFADGRWGQNWNNTIGVAGQGVSGLWVAAGLQTDAGQMGAQVWGGIALLIWGFVLPWSLFKFLNLLTHLRLPRKISSESEGAPGCLDGVVHVNDGS